MSSCLPKIFIVNNIILNSKSNTFSKVKLFNCAFLKRPMATFDNESKIFLKFDNKAIRELPIDKELNNFTRQVSASIFSFVNPTPVDNPKLVAYSLPALKSLGFTENDVNKKEFVYCLAGCEKFAGSQTYSHCYCGHQFGSFAGQLGDGAAIYLGEVLGENSQRLELQLKGAGKTPFSRDADGRKVLRSSIREFLASEAMYYLGIPTTRAGTVITSDTKVIRDIFYDGNAKMERASIVLRISPTFIRFGSFEICKPLSRNSDRKGPSVNTPETLDVLFKYTVKNYYLEIWQKHNMDNHIMCLEFLKEVAKRTGYLVALWQCYGFCHGVLNTDNMSILGLTIDYGPYGFMDRYDPNFICNSSDSGGRYTYANQPDVCKWNVGKLCEALHSYLEAGDSEIVLDSFQKSFDESYLNISRKKLGLLNSLDDKLDEKLIKEFYDVMEINGSDFTNSWRVLSKLSFPGSEDFDENFEITLNSLLNESSTRDELMLAFAPRMDNNELEMMVRLVQMNPAILERLGVGANLILREIKCREILQEIQTLNESDIKKRHEEKWKTWLVKYIERLDVNTKSAENQTDLEILNTTRRKLMNSINPRVILRNYIAQSVIDKAETDDFSVIRNILKVLEKPFDSQDDMTTSQATNVENINYVCKPPPWAAKLKVT